MGYSGTSVPFAMALPSWRRTNADRLHSQSVRGVWRVLSTTAHPPDVGIVTRGRGGGGTESPVTTQRGAAFPFILPVALPYKQQKMRKPLQTDNMCVRPSRRRHLETCIDGTRARARTASCQCHCRCHGLRSCQKHRFHQTRRWLGRGACDTRLVLGNCRGTPLIAYMRTCARTGVANRHWASARVHESRIR